MGRTSGKNLRVNLRIDAESKKTLERAASYAGSTLSDFVLTNALAAASRAIREQETIALSKPDWDVFFEALMNPPEPSGRLKRALKRHDHLYG